MKHDKYIRIRAPYGDVQIIPAYVKYWGENEFLCVVHRVVSSKRDCLFVDVVFRILLVIDNEEGEVWNVKAMNLRTGSGSIGIYR